MSNSFTVKWNDRSHNANSFFYYVALHARYECDFEEKFFLNKDKAEAYAHQLYNENYDVMNDACGIDLITDIRAFND